MALKARQRSHAQHQSPAPHFKAACALDRMRPAMWQCGQSRCLQTAQAPLSIRTCKLPPSRSQARCSPQCAAILFKHCQRLSPCSCRLGTCPNTHIMTSALLLRDYIRDICVPHVMTEHGYQVGNRMCCRRQPGGERSRWRRGRRRVGGRHGQLHRAGGGGATPEARGAAGDFLIQANFECSLQILVVRGLFSSCGRRRKRRRCRQTRR